MPLDRNGNSYNLHLNADPFRCCVCGNYTPRHLCKSCATDPRLCVEGKTHPAVLALQRMADTGLQERDESRQQRDRVNPQRQQQRRRQWSDSKRKRRSKVSTTNI